MSMRLTGTVMGLCMAATVSMAQADVYKWTDAEGHVHYGDQAKTGAEKIVATPGAGQAAPADNKGADADKQKQHVDDCGRKRDQLMTYQKATRIVETDSLGNEKEYSEAERQKLVEKTYKQVSDGCADVPVETAKPK